MLRCGEHTRTGPKPLDGLARQRALGGRGGIRLRGDREVHADQSRAVEPRVEREQSDIAAEVGHAGDQQRHRCGHLQHGQDLTEERAAARTPDAKAFLFQQA